MALPLQPKFAAALLVIALTAPVRVFGQASLSPEAAAREPAAPEALVLTGQIRGTHDPALAVEHGKYYVFATGAAFPSRPDGSDVPPPPAPPPGTPVAGSLAIRPERPNTQLLPQFPVRCSDDLHNWTRCGEVFPAIPAWILETSPATRELWAPDVSFFDGLYHLYYAFSAFGKNTSGIALATNETLDRSSPRYKWIDRGLVLRSYATDDFNAIDPNLILDPRGEAWLSFGSFWGGIKMRHLDRHTGLLSTSDPKLYSLAARTRTVADTPRNPDLPPDSEAVEAPFILQHGNFYYLFVSWDLCCRGLKSTYRTMVGRSKNVTGPYLDKSGMPMAAGGGSPFLQATSLWLGPGGESLLHLPTEDLIVFHAYSATDGRPSLHISTVGWRDGWPEARLEGDGK